MCNKHEVSVASFDVFEAGRVAEITSLAAHKLNYLSSFVCEISIKLKLIIHVWKAVMLLT